jgi:signal peptidase I
VRVDGISMEPAYHNGRMNLINRLAYWRSEPKRGDVVGIRLAGVSVMYMKRIIGLPGERVTFRNGKVLINDQPLEEPYVKYRARWGIPELILDPDEYYAIGDNRGMDPDGHEGGGVRRNRIVGKVLF